MAVCSRSERQRHAQPRQLQRAAWRHAMEPPLAPQTCRDHRREIFPGAEQEEILAVAAVPGTAVQEKVALARAAAVHPRARTRATLV